MSLPRRIAPVIDSEFDIADTKEAVGDGITAAEPNDCDHRFQYSTFTNETRCIFCGRKPTR